MGITRKEKTQVRTPGCNLCKFAKQLFPFTRLYICLTSLVIISFAHCLPPQCILTLLLDCTLQVQQSGQRWIFYRSAAVQHFSPLKGHSVTQMKPSSRNKTLFPSWVSVILMALQTYHYHFPGHCVKKAMMGAGLCGAVTAGYCVSSRSRTQHV